MTPLRREEVLDYETRRALYTLISQQPGLHLRELERRSRLPLATLRHHIRYLEVHKLIESVADRNVHRFFTVGLDAASDRRILSALRQNALRRVVLFVLEQGGSAPYSDIVESLGTPVSTLAVHLSELTRRGILERETEGRSSSYRAVEPERLIQTLHTFKRSFYDAWVDHLLEVVYGEDEDAPSTSTQGSNSGHP